MEDTQTTTNTKVLSNGAVYDLDKKKIVAGAVLTSDKAREMVRRRVELKQERVLAGAAKVLERTGDWEAPADLDVVEAIAEAAMEKALDVDNKGQIDAAKFILVEAGLSAANSRREDAPNAPGSGITGSPQALMQLVGMIEADRQAAVERARAVDVEATDIRNE